MFFPPLMKSAAEARHTNASSKVYSTRSWPSPSRTKRINTSFIGLFLHQLSIPATFSGLRPRSRPDQCPTTPRVSPPVPLARSRRIGVRDIGVSDRPDPCHILPCINEQGGRGQAYKR